MKNLISSIEVIKDLIVSGFNISDMECIFDQVYADIIGLGINRDICQQEE